MSPAASPPPQPPALAPPSAEGEHRAIAGRAGIVGLGTLASRVLGLARDQTMAAIFRLGVTDAFMLAFTIPNALRSLLAEGGVTSAVVPVLTEVRARAGDEGARRFFARVRGMSLLVLLVVSLLGVAFARPLVELFGGGLEDRPLQFERTVQLTRVVFPYIFFMGTAALGMAALHTYRQFVVASFAPALLNVAMLVACFAFRRPLIGLGWDPALALSIGALLGGALQVLAQIPSLRRLGFASRPQLSFADPDVRAVLRRIGPRTLGLGIYYVDLVVCRRLLSGLGEGAQSYFSWAQRLCDFPQGIFVMALSAATLPSLAQQATTGDRAGLGATFSFGMRLALFVALPVTVLYGVLADPLVTAIYQRGRFGPESAHQTALALMAQGTGVWTMAAVRQLVPVFFVLDDTRTPVLVSAVALLALIIVALGLNGPLGHVGVSLAVSASSFVQMLCLWALLSRRLETLGGGGIAVSAGRTLLASAAAGAAGYLVAGQLAPLLLRGPYLRLLPALLGAASFALVFLAVARALRSPELLVITGGLRRKLARSAA